MYIVWAREYIVLPIVGEWEGEMKEREGEGGEGGRERRTDGAERRRRDMSERGEKRMKKRSREIGEKRGKERDGREMAGHY